ncbi:MAG: hypothetical protein C0599_09815 [Salinivirgaceae bacterium]|nr:MAG: hypothetical protein C0599_09815 [Salinivirgaceae bacterium]
MELKEAIILVIVIMVFTVIVTILKGRGKKGIGYVSMTFHEMFHFKVGILKVDGSRQFSMVVENSSDVDVVIKDMYLEIKNGTRYEKQTLPASSFDNTKEMIIPSGKSGAAFLSMKEFKKYLNGQTILKAVAEDDSGKAFKSKIMQIDPSNMKLELK